MMLMLKDVVARNVRAQRLACKMTQEQMAFRAGLSSIIISRIERGVGNPTVDTLETIAGALEVSPARLLDENFTTDDPLEKCFNLIRGMSEKCRNEAVVILQNYFHIAKLP